MKKRRDANIRQLILGFVAIRDFLRGKVAYRVLFLSAFLAFLIAGKSLGVNSDSVVWHWIFFSALLTAPLVACNAAEYWLIAKTNDLDLSFLHCVRVTLFGSVANLLPIPGQSVTRIADLGSRSVPVSQATHTTLAAGILWSGWILIFAASASFNRQPLIFSLNFLVLGLICCAVSFNQISNRSWRLRWMVAGSLIEVMTVTIAWWRLIFSFEAIGVEYTLSSAAILMCANVVSSMVGLAPAGLGIREAVGALIAPLVSIDPLAAAVSIALSRFVGITVCALCVFVCERPR